MDLHNANLESSEPHRRRIGKFLLFSILVVPRPQNKKVGEKKLDIVLII